MNEPSETNCTDTLARPERNDPTDCRDCDGFGMCWNNADPTSCQWVGCKCGDTRGHP